MFYQYGDKKQKQQAVNYINDFNKNRPSEIPVELPIFLDEYYAWYAEVLALIKQLLPLDLVTSFKKYYEVPKFRKEVNYETYVISDLLLDIYVRGTNVTPSYAILKFRQQLAILKACEQRFETSLFDIKHLLQADLFDSELDAAKELNKKGFERAAGTF